MNLAVKQGRSPNQLIFAAGQDSRRIRLRAVSEEKDAYLKYINKDVAKKICKGQIVLAILIGVIQVGTSGLVVGEYSYDSAADIGVGVWSSMITFFAAVETIWCLKHVKYWKLHLSLILHVFSMIATIILLIVQLGSNVPHIRYKLGKTLFSVKDANSTNYYAYYDTEHNSPSLLIISLALNYLMTFAGLIQLTCSFLITIMMGRAICCGTNRPNGRIFELELSGAENKEGILVIKRGDVGNGYINGHTDAMDTANLQRSSSMEEPPSYSNTLSKVI